MLYWKVKRIFIAFYTNAIIIFKENECTKIAITIFLKSRWRNLKMQHLLILWQNSGWTIDWWRDDVCLGWWLDKCHS